MYLQGRSDHFLSTWNFQNPKYTQVPGFLILRDGAILPDFAQLTTNAQFTDQSIFVQNMLKRAQFQQLLEKSSLIFVFI